MGKLAERRGRKATGLRTQSKTAGLLPRGTLGSLICLRPKTGKRNARIEKKSRKKLRENERRNASSGIGTCWLHKGTGYYAGAAVVYAVLLCCFLVCYLYRKIRKTSHNIKSVLIDWRSMGKGPYRENGPLIGYAKILVSSGVHATE